MEVDKERLGSNRMVHASTIGTGMHGHFVHLYTFLRVHVHDVESKQILHACIRFSQEIKFENIQSLNYFLCH